MKNDTVAQSSPLYLVLRYHSATEVFTSEREAVDFATNCGDFKDMKKSEKKPILPLTTA